MREFIVSVPDEKATLFIYRFGIDGTKMFGHELTGEVVRCCDCATVDEEHYGEWGRVWYCEQFGDVEPDGFCAWGERSDKRALDAFESQREAVRNLAADNRDTEPEPGESGHQERTCGSCRWWHKWSWGTDAGDCHRYPKAIGMLETGWCGEWKEER